MPNTFYPPMPRSPATELADDIDHLETSIPVLNPDVFPDPPNLATIGMGMMDVVMDSGTATAGTSTTLEDDTKDWDDTGDGQWAGYIVRIIGGTGAGQRRTILSNTDDTLIIETAWGTDPDDTSIYEIISRVGSPVSETIIYTGKDIGALTGCTRGYEPEFSNRSWPGGTHIARVMTAQDLRAVQERVEVNEGDIGTLNTITGLHDGQINDLEDNQNMLLEWLRVRSIWGAI